LRIVAFSSGPVYNAARIASVETPVNDPTLPDNRIASLPTAVDPAIREELTAILKTLRSVKNPLVVLLSLSRLALRLMRIIFTRAGHTAPSDNLFDCLVTAGRGDPDHKIKGLKIVPDEILTGLHAVRTLANKADHAAESVALSADDAENALRLYLRAVEWYYHEAEFGPRLARQVRRPPLFRPGCYITITITILLAIFVVVLGWELMLLTKASQRPRPVSLPAWTKNLPAADVLTLLAEGHPPDPAGQVARPRLSLDLLARRKGEKGFSRLNDGASLASKEDQYLMVIRPETAGWLYVFQLDARGAVTWFWPRNATWDLSAGSNPVVAEERLQIPPGERRTALFLDNTIGVEHIGAVFSAVPWPELEDALEKAARARPTEDVVPERLAVTRGVEDEDARGPGGEQTVEIDLGEDRVPLNLSAREQTAVSSFLILSRWFHHVAPPKQ
jgi:Domain of unknown function (DUF4384)